MIELPQPDQLSRSFIEVQLALLDTGLVPVEKVGDVYENIGEAVHMERERRYQEELGALEQQIDDKAEEWTEDMV